MILFVNACMRGKELSRTYRLCEAWLKNLSYVEVDLSKKIPPCLDGETIENRDPALAEQFAKAEIIVVGAPYWDLSFPAALKAYIENVSVKDITFKMTPTATEGLCRAKKLVYITTAGSDIENADYGTQYFHGLCGFFGIPEFESYRADRLDVEGIDIEKIMVEAENKILEGKKC